MTIDTVADIGASVEQRRASASPRHFVVQPRTKSAEAERMGCSRYIAVIYAALGSGWGAG
jgi:hypothetical protein